MCAYYVYILKCSDNSHYTGITNNIELWFQQHEPGHHKECCTFSRSPLSLEFLQEFADVLQAIYFEKTTKGWTRAKKNALIVENFDMLQILAERRNPTHHKYKTFK